MSRAKTAVVIALLAAVLSTGCRDALGPSNDSPRPSFGETQGSDN